ncbi:hypothetical protein H0H81_002915, partial [Sphagnurus paluster]
IHHKNNKARPAESLTAGDLFMVEEKNYAAHLVVAKEVKEKGTCNEHRAVAEKFVKHIGLDVSGIGATACSRHGAFCPGGVVDFQRGEGQRNIDFSMCHGVARSNVKGIKRIRHIYDVNCQHCVNFRKHVLQNPNFLSYPFDEIETIFGIGEFHINGHIPKCFARYSPQFIEGAANMDGEILESLWAEINEISPSCAPSSLPNRTETLDDHFNSSNFRKGTAIHSTIVKKYRKAVQGAEESEKYFEELAKNISLDKVKLWDTQVAKAQANRTKDVTVMDIFDVQIASCKRPNSCLLNLTMVQKRIALDRRISQHHTEAGQYLPAAAVAAFLGSATINVDDGWFDEEDPDEEAAPMPTNGDFNLDNDDRLPESRSILLPSNMSKQDRKAFGLNSLRKKELALRQGQANEALQAIRIGIGEKSFRFRNNFRPANSKGLKTRAWTLINNAGKKLQQHRLLYRQARQAMILLGADHLTRETYKDLTTDDMKTSTAVQQTNASGQRNAELSWIWRMEGIFDGDEDAFVTELQRVNWIRAKSPRDRWKEELAVTQHEMVWVLLWLQHRAKMWTKRAEGTSKPELAPYAYQQAANWEGMKQIAHTIFLDTNPDLADIFNYSEFQS